MLIYVRQLAPEALSLMLCTSLVQALATATLAVHCPSVELGSSRRTTQYLHQSAGAESALVWN